jgi:Holliday junction resolvasome RuvABC endonuclease subunit
MKIKVIGIDPALRNMGFAHGTYDTVTGEVEIVNLVLTQTEAADKKTAKVLRKNSDDLARASILHEAMQKEAGEATFAFIEVPVGSQSSRAMASYGICVGIIASCPIPYFQLTPSEVKLIATGSKFASKEEMIAWASKTYPNANWLKRKSKGELVMMNDNEHLADAVAAIHAGVNGSEFRQAITMFAAMEKASA